MFFLTEDIHSKNFIRSFSKLTANSFPIDYDAILSVNSSLMPIDEQHYFIQNFSFKNH